MYKSPESLAHHKSPSTTPLLGDAFATYTEASTLSNAELISTLLPLPLIDITFPDILNVWFVPGPVGPVGPTLPCGPTSPLVPCGPCGPLGPVTPISPFCPFSPAEPLLPVGPCGPTSPLSP